MPFLVVLAMTLAAPVPKPRPLYFYPTSLGAKSVFSVGKLEVTTTVTAIEVKEETTTVTTESTLPDGQIVPSEKMAVSANGLMLLESSGFPIDPPQPLLKLPAGFGVAWELDVTEQKSPLGTLPGISGTLTLVGPEAIEVKAGRFKTVKVELADKAGKRMRMWFAPDVGLVKSEAENHKRELKSFTPGTLPKK